MVRPEAYRLTAARLVGRAKELAQLSRAAEDASRGEGLCVLIGGEAGIGKTRLVEELRTQFRGQVFEAQCYEEESSFAFAPLQSGLRALRKAGDEVDAASFARRAGALAGLLPELADLHDNPPGGPESADPATRQRALFEALAGLLFEVAARRPLLVLFEDLHWSDDGTLAFLRFLVRRLAGHAILLIATYRSPAGAALSELGAFADLLLSLQRERAVQQIMLQPLSRIDIGSLLRDLFDSPQLVSPDFLDAVAAFSEGNPLYVEELVRAMIQAGDLYRVRGVWERKRPGELRVPGSVQESVRRRSEALEPATRRLLAIAAVAGLEFAFELLAEVTRRSETELLIGLKELIRAGFIVEEAADRFAFRHALIREAVLGELLARERRALHARFAEVLAHRHAAVAETAAAELAHHYYEAEDWPNAMLTSRRAAEEAKRLDASREALIHLTHALTCAEKLGLEPPVGLLLDRAELYDRTGEFELAEADLAAALAGAERAGRPKEAWQALTRLGYLWFARDYSRSLKYLERGLAVADDLGDALVRAETLNHIGNVYLNRDQPGEALPYHQAALAAFETVRDLAGQANTLEMLGVCYYNLPDVLAGAASEELALSLARAAGAPQSSGLDGRARNALFHASIHLLLPLRFDTEVGPPVDAQRLIRQGEEALRIARTMSWPGGEAQALGLLGGFHGLLGEYGTGIAYLYEGLQLVEQLEHLAGISASQRMIAQILLELLAYDEAVDRLRRAWSSARDADAGLFADIAVLGLCQALAQQGRRQDLAEAEHLLSEVLGQGHLAGGRSEREALAVRAELELAQGKPLAALATLETLIAATCHLAEYGLQAVPRLAWLLGEALRGSGRVKEAEEALEAAGAGAAAQGRKGLLWRAEVARGRLCLDLRQRNAAQDHFEQARTVISELAAGLADAVIPEAHLREGFLKKALATVPERPAPTPRRMAKEAHHGLTQREIAVARLVAEGRSNREIAEELVISERTAERHVANILDKLGLKSRVQLAAWVAENLASV